MKKYRSWGLTAVAVFLALYVTGILFPMVFYLNDDVTMRSILSGTYTGVPDGHAVYMKYPLTGLISLLYRLFGEGPWFSLFMVGFFWLSVTMVLEHLAHIAGRIGKAGISLMACMALLCVALFVPQTIYLHYTVVAAVLGGCGLFLAAMGGEKKAIVLFVLCYCVRSQVFFLLLPFLAVILLWLLWEKRSIQQLVMPAFLTVGILVCIAWNGLMYRSEDWQQFESYNESRTQLYDYLDVLPYDEYAGQYESVGIGEWEYSIMEQYALALEKEVDAGKLQAAADIYTAKRGAERSPSEYFIFCLTEYYYHTRYTDKPYNYILMCVYVLAAVLLLWMRKWVQLLLVCGMAAGRSIIWVFLIWQGRFPERIYISLYLLEIMALAGMLCSLLTERNTVGSARPGNKGTSAVVACACGFLSLLLIGVGIAQMKAAVERASTQLEKQREWNALTDYCAGNSNNFYLLDTWSMVSYAGEVWEDASGKTNYLLAGGWMSAMPLLQERIRSMGAEDGGELLGRGDAGETNILYIAAPDRDMQWLFEYLSQRFGEIRTEQVDSIILDGEEAFRVYCVVYN